MTSINSVTARRPIQQIDLYCPQDRAYWSHRFGISDAELRQAIKMTGSRASTVAAHLGLSIR
ncbi:DUF3606 domain-containing protein [Methylobacterium crusticola]|uniref:DUF3606 domain-containing protein n=1 Tax=Methylobacterium crusticola TaxID=1697972 RepID=UPI000FFB691B